MGNFGTDVNTWQGVFFFLLTAATAIVFATYLVKLIIHVQNGKPAGPGRRSRVLRTRQEAYDRRAMRLTIVTLIFGSLMVIMVVMFFVAFGPGQPVQPRPAAEDGMRQLNEQAPPAPTDKQLEQDAKDKKEPALKRQDEGPQKDIKEADDYIDNLIKKRQQGQAAPNPEKKGKE